MSLFFISGNSKYVNGYAVALMNHFATKETELSLRVGDVITDLRRTGKDGIFEVRRCISSLILGEVDL
jgi:hypothetical protein